MSPPPPQHFILLTLFLACGEFRGGVAEYRTEPSTLDMNGVLTAETTYKDMLADCADIPWSICVGGKPLLPRNRLKSLIGSWNFDDMLGHDSSSNANDVAPPPPAGPARGGIGQSAYFNGTNFAVIPHSGVFETPKVTVMFWMYLLQDATASWRTILMKGDGTKEVTPSIQLQNLRNALHVRVTTQTGEVVAVDSIAIIPLERWTHVALVVQDKLLQIYVNGIMDTQHVMESKARFNRDTWYVGRDPAHQGTAMYLDELRMYGDALNDNFLMAVSEGALGPISPKFVRLGCTKCEYQAAKQNCGPGSDHPGYHLCNKRELMSGAMLVARAQGWLHRSPVMWFEDMPEGADLNGEKLAMCCKDQM